MSRAPQLLACLALCCCQAAGAQSLSLPPPPAARFAPAIGAQLPLDAVLRDEAGAPVRLQTLFGKAPVVLVPGYYSCRNLCSTLFEGVLQALALSGMQAGSYRLAGFSIDPQDGAQAAAGKRAAYASLLPGGAKDLRMLTADPATLARLERALGYKATRDPDSGEFAHAAGFVVADKEGRIARYFPGLRFEPAALRTALQAAQDGQPGAAGTLGERLLLLCSHYDPAVGRHSAAAMGAVRAAALLVALSLGAWLWRRRSSPAPKEGRP